LRGGSLYGESGHKDRFEVRSYMDRDRGRWGDFKKNVQT